MLAFTILSRANAKHSQIKITSLGTRTAFTWLPQEPFYSGRKINKRKQKKKKSFSIPYTHDDAPPKLGPRYSTPLRSNPENVPLALGLQSEVTRARGRR